MQVCPNCQKVTPKQLMAGDSCALCARNALAPRCDTLNKYRRMQEDLQTATNEIDSLHYKMRALAEGRNEEADNRS